MIFLAQHLCCRLLGIDPKTLRRWVALAQIAFLKSPLDARLRCLTSASLQYLATIHDRPLDPSLVPGEIPSSEKLNAPHAEPDPPQEPSASLVHLQQLVETLQLQVSQLALDLLQERRRREEQEQKTRQILLSSQPSASKEASPKDPHMQDPPKLAPSSRKGRPRALIPLIAVQSDGSYLVVCPQHGELHIPPDSRQWFTWLDTLSSFRFLGRQGRLSTYRKQGKASWMAYRRLHGHVSQFSLGTTNQLTIAHLEHMASLLQTPAS
ncbi:hypothetical protein KSC_024580 [Ktedonobacter sp. SOSP1-52]|uniref:hypothetical protein n=1 Tax=Ktedonobacter sp. SOSP1-52 TaxID=2778366 RepID=UPI0019152D9F|nr:hypothetical protein [Ktedonobacter sp. SOSP1-52]GHO63566.1 hypothetical protein KSC_024580 [Ktedonobacter sp. SOSP1-52]